MAAGRGASRNSAAVFAVIVFSSSSSSSASCGTTDTSNAGTRNRHTLGAVRQDVDPRKVAAFLVAAAEGSYGLAKSAGSRAMLRSNLEMLATYLDSLRSPRIDPESTARPE